MHRSRCNDKVYIEEAQVKKNGQTQTIRCISCSCSLVRKELTSVSKVAVNLLVEDLLYHIDSLLIWKKFKEALEKKRSLVHR